MPADSPTLHTPTSSHILPLGSALMHYGAACYPGDVGLPHRRSMRPAHQSRKAGADFTVSLSLDNPVFYAASGGACAARQLPIVARHHALYERQADSAHSVR